MDIQLTAVFERVPEGYIGFVRHSMEDFDNRETEHVEVTESTP